jgi:hypothetical protein
MDTTANTTGNSVSATTVSAPTVATAKVKHFKLSLIWTQTVLQPIRELTGAAPGPTDYCLHDINAFKAHFDRAQTEAAVAFKEKRAPHGQLIVPWEHSSGFWKNYLREDEKQKEGVDLSTVKSPRAVKSLVPLRARVPVKKITAIGSQSDIVVSLQAFVYPHGLAIVATANVRAVDPGGLTLPQTVQTAMRIKKTDTLSVQWRDGTTEKLPLTVIVAKCIDTLRTAHFEPNAPIARDADLTDPFSIMTVIKAEGVDPSQPVVQGGDIHKALRAATQLVTASYENDEPGNLAKAYIPTQQAYKYSKGRFFFRSTRGRAIWFPNTFMQTVERVNSLSCFHRNTVFASMQVESLSNLVEALLAESNKGFTNTKKEYARRALVMLRLLYSRTKGTYRSYSPGMQMLDNDTVSSINALQIALGLNLTQLPTTEPTPLPTS